VNIFYQYNATNNYHLSVGALVFNEQFEICTHHFYRHQIPKRLHFLLGDLIEGYHLVRETLENDETLHQAVHRGIKEEIGAEGVIEKYLGSVVCAVETPTAVFQKTTLYHAVRLLSLGERTGVDEESESKLEWYSPQDLLQIYRRQVEQTDRVSFTSRNCTPS
jgi:hypothetical protein